MLLRVVRNRGLAAGVGFVMVLPAVWLQLDPRYASWWTEGGSLVSGATGLALIYSALFGVKPDWTDAGDGEP
jgi:hypothetical protein